jgi:hypothetical protein
VTKVTLPQYIPIDDFNDDPSYRENRSKGLQNPVKSGFDSPVGRKR